jgi:hypothetical protein
VPFVEIRGYLFGFFVSEPPNEPPHVHVKGKGGTAKLWLEPVRLVRSDYSVGETSDIVEIVRNEEARFMGMWRERFEYR